MISTKASTAGLHLPTSRPIQALHVEQEKTARSNFQRRELFLITLAVVIVAASLPSIRGAITEFGTLGAIMAAFNISAIVWAAYYLALNSIIASNAVGSPTRLDWTLCIASISICFLPIGGTAWLLMFAIGIFLVLTSNGLREWSNAGWVFMAITVPEFWGRRIFNFFSDFILEIDAKFVSALTQTERMGNVVEMPGGGGALIIGAPCSSMANVSLAVLCWVLFSRYRVHRWSYWNIFWCLLTAISIMLINVIRITIIGYYPQYYIFLHDGGGVVVFSWLSAAAAVGISLIGVRHVNSRQN